VGSEAVGGVAADAPGLVQAGQASAAADRLAAALTDLYCTLDEKERAVLSGVVWRTLPAVERIRFADSTPQFSDAEQLLLEELDR